MRYTDCNHCLPSRRLQGVPICQLPLSRWRWVPVSQLPFEGFRSPRLSPSHSLTLPGACGWVLKCNVLQDGLEHWFQHYICIWRRRDTQGAAPGLEPMGPNPEALRMSVVGAVRQKREEVNRHRQLLSAPASFPPSLITHFNLMGLIWIIHSICSPESDLQMLEASFCNLVEDQLPQSIPPACVGSSTRAGVEY